MIKTTTIRPGFILLENYFSPEEATIWLSEIFPRGEDLLRGFHHPHVKPNRFHKAPKYPVKKYMCYGLYWNPLDYMYYPVIPESGVKPFPIPLLFQSFCDEVLKNYAPEYANYTIEAVMVNFYTDDSTMGLHVDKDEEDTLSPIIGVNFGSSCRFNYEDEAGSIQSVRIPGNSVYIFGGEARLMKHGVGGIYSKTVPTGQEKFFSNKERLNLTFRKVYSQDN